MRKMQRGETQWPQWIEQNIKEGGRVGVNPLLMNAGFNKHISKSIEINRCFPET